jgi:hypothetical protein
VVVLLQLELAQLKFLLVRRVLLGLLVPPQVLRQLELGPEPLARLRVPRVQVQAPILPILVLLLLLLEGVLARTPVVLVVLLLRHQLLELQVLLLETL